MILSQKAENIDFELSFLNNFVQQQVNEGKATYDPDRSLMSQSARGKPVSTLNYKAYE